MIIHMQTDIILLNGIQLNINHDREDQTFAIKIYTVR